PAPAAHRARREDHAGGREQPLPRQGGEGDRGPAGLVPRRGRLMVSAFTHAATAVACGTLVPRERLPRRAWLVGAVAAALPDIDYFLHRGDWFADGPYTHRGFTHSLLFAAALGGVLTAVAAWRRWPGAPAWWFGYLALCTASHGAL